MRILALNPGSGTLRYALVLIPGRDEPAAAERTVASGYFDHVHGVDTVRAAERAVGECLPHGIDAIGYRVVHGGSRFACATRITPEVVEAIRPLAELAPLHNPINLAVIEAAERRAPGVPGVAVFDTAFHRTLPEVAWRYALPAEAGEDAEVRRYGFHGIAHRYVSERLIECLGENARGSRLISCHLGGGASVCAVRDGASVDTSMGLTPLEGLVMSTRCGDVDPGLLLHLLRRGNMSVDDLEEILTKRSGLLGISGKSGDLRDLEPAAANGDSRAQLALDVQAYRVRKYIGAYTAVLGGVDAIGLSGALAENSIALRARVLSGLEFLGIHIDPILNKVAGPSAPCQISSTNAVVPVWVIPADEESQIAREVAGVLQNEN
jgi:acetate kinase